jgi:3-hydroxyacyl-[acyl-carrier-protein] dehydratase
MRFLFYDQVLELEKKRAIVGTKNFPLSEEFYRRHFSKVALVPGVIFIEAMAQLLGWLICYSYDFEVSCIMSLIEGVKVPARLKPGGEARIHGEIISTTDKDTLGTAWVEIAGDRVASIDRVIYIHFRETDPAELAERFVYLSGRRDLLGDLGNESRKR